MVQQNKIGKKLFPCLILEFQSIPFKLKNKKEIIYVPIQISIFDSMSIIHSQSLFPLGLERVFWIKEVGKEKV